MFSALIVGFAASGQLFDFIDGKALGFGHSFSEIRVDCYTDKGVKIVSNHRCTVNPDGGWCITVDEGPQNVKSYLVTVRPDQCLSKTFRVAVPKSGRPSLTIKKTEFVFGDLNGNNVVDPIDVLIVQDVMGIRKGDPEWSQCGKRINIIEPAETFDFNSDGVIDDKDVAMVKVNLGKRAAKSA